jgi:pyruvate dehydrogenase E1 component alpha subunit
METDLPSREHARHLLHQMTRIRRFEEKAAELYSAGKIRGFLHLYVGEEAVAVGVNEALNVEDGIVATYREHGQALARGIGAASIMAEMYGRVEGCSRGRGGSMHLFSAEHRFYGGNAIVAGGLPLAVGLALAAKMQGKSNVTACFFGDGASAEGEFHESLNLAGLWGLPVAFLCENNLYAMGTAIERAQADESLFRKAKSYGIDGRLVDGMDVMAVEAATRETFAAIRADGRPRFIEFRTYRLRAHSMFDPELYRDKEEVDAWRREEPISTFARFASEQHLLGPADREEIEQQVAAELAEAVAFAEAGTTETFADMLADVYTPRPE